MNWDEAHLLGDLEAQEERRMTDDLVERLRWAADNSNGCGEWNCAPGDLDEAADRIEELEAKLAKAVEALDRVDGNLTNLQPKIPQSVSREWVPVIDSYVDLAICAARTALAELTGENT